MFAGSHLKPEFGLGGTQDHLNALLDTRLLQVRITVKSRTLLALVQFQNNVVLDLTLYDSSPLENLPLESWP